MAGFVFHPPSKRHLDETQAAALAAQLDPSIERVALLVDPDDAQIDVAMRAISPHRLQLHGDETPERVAQIKTQIACPIIKALAVATPTDIARAQDFAAHADWFLFDSKPAGAAFGGTGKAFDWSLLAGQKIAHPWLLAGGLDPDNIGAAIAQSGAEMVDVSSGIEREVGRKDPARMRKFIANIAAEVR